MACVNQHNPHYKQLVKETGNPVISMLEFDRIYNDETIPENPSLKEGLSWLESVLPNIVPELNSGLIDGIAKGSYDRVDKLMKLSREFADKGTIKHEAVHIVMDFIDKKKRDSILDDAARRWKIDRSNEDLLEERIAHLAETSMDQLSVSASGLSFTGNIDGVRSLTVKNFVDWLKSLFYRITSDKVDSLLRDLNRGGFDELRLIRRSKLQEKNDQVNNNDFSNTSTLVNSEVIRNFSSDLRDIFGLDKEKSKASSVLFERVIATVSARSGKDLSAIADSIKFMKGDKVLLKKIDQARSPEERVELLTNALFQIIPYSGAKLISPKHIKSNLDATRLKRLDRSPQDIYEETGWIYRNDRWFVEVPDGNLKNTDVIYDKVAQGVKEGEEIVIGNLADYFDLSDLAKAYPKINAVKLYLFNEKEKEGGTFRIGSYDPSRKDAGLNYEIFKTLAPWSVAGLSRGGISKVERETRELDKRVLEDYIRGVFIHEIQHFVQVEEGLPGGSSYEISDVELKTRYNDDTFKVIKKGVDLKKDPLDIELDVLQYIAKREGFENYSDTVLNHYRNQIGEVQARSAQDRRNLTEGQRKNTMFQDIKGAVQLLEDGASIIHALTSPDVSTPMHELAHIYEQYLTPQEIKTIESWSKNRSGTTEFSEAFAEGFEAYLQEGKAPNEALQSIFDKFAEWLSDIYNSILRKDLNDPMRRIYDQMLSGGHDVTFVKNPLKANVLYQTADRATVLKQKKIDRVNEQITVLNENGGKLNNKQQDTINKLIDNLEEYKKALINDEKTISVTKLIGGGKIKDGELYKDYAEFGTFIHHVVEEIQKESMDKNDLLVKLFTKDRFYEIFDNYPAVFNVDGLVDRGVVVGVDEDGQAITMNKINDDLYDMVLTLLGPLQTLLNEGATLLPEISVMGRNVEGEAVIGRLDLLVLDKQGRVRIVDFKTKKIQLRAVTNREAYFLKTYQNTASGSTIRDLRMEKMNTYDKWDLQLGVYENMLGQLGISVPSKSIYAVAYFGHGSEDDSGYFMYDHFVPIVYHSDEENSSGREVAFRKFKRIIDKSVPVGEQTEEKAETKKDPFDLKLDMSKEEEQEFLDNLIKTAQEQLKFAVDKLKQLDDANQESSEVTYWKNRRESMRSIIERLERDDWKLANKLATTIQTLESNTIELRTEATKSKDIQDNSERIDKISQMVRAAEGFGLFTNELKKMLISAGFDHNNGSIVALNRIENNVVAIRQIQNEVDLFKMVEMIQTTLTDSQKEGKIKERADAIDPKIRLLRKEINKLRSGGTPGINYNSIWGKVKYFVGASPTKPEDLTIERLIQEKEILIQRLEFKKRLGVEMTPGEIRQYIHSILNKDSQDHIGSETAFTTPLLASASSGDLVTAGFTKLLKRAATLATQEFVNSIEREGIQKDFDDYRKSMGSLDKMNDAISEIRSIPVYNEIGELQDERKEVRSFINPIAQEYYDKIDTYRKELSSLNFKIRENPTDQALKDRRSSLKTEARAWELENTTMPFVDEFYKLDQYLPEDYKQKRDELYTESRLLEDSLETINDSNNADEVMDRIEMIEVELNILKLDTIKNGNGQLEEYMELRNQFFEYDKNYGLFERLKNSKEVEFSDEDGVIDEVKMNEWLSKNANRVASQQWKDEISEIMDEVSDILGSNAEMQEWNQKKYEVLSRYRIKGTINPNHLTPEELNDITEIENFMENARLIAKQERGKLSKSDSNRLTALYSRLDEMRSSDYNPYYVREFENRSQALDQKYSRYSDLKEKSEGVTLNDQDSAELERVLEQFILEENDFEVWYNNHHTNVYESILTRKEDLMHIPRSFNMIKVPTEEKDYVWEPNGKYSLRKVKDAAINPNFKKDHNGYALPRGTSGSGTMIMGDSPWINPKYTELNQNKPAFDYYNKFISRYLEVQTETSGKKLGFFYPGYEAKSMDTYNKQGILKGVKNRAKLSFEKAFGTDNPYAHDVNEYATNMDRIQFKHNHVLPIEQQSSDGIGSVILWREQAEINKAATAIRPEAQSIVRYLEHLSEELKSSGTSETDKRVKELNQVISQVKFEYGKFVNGETKKDQGDLSRVGDLLLRGIGFTRLAFDIPNHVGNMLSGNVQAFLGGHKSGLYNHSDLAWAKSKIYAKDGLIAGLIQDQTKIGGKSYMTKMMMYFNPTQDSLEHNYDRTRTQSDRIVQGVLDLNASFWLQDKGETEISSSIWLAIMNNTKVKLVDQRGPEGEVLSYQMDENGNIKTVNAFEAYQELNTGEIAIREDVDWSKEEEFALMNSVWSEGRRTQGNYAGWDKTLVEQGFLGRLGMYYRKYLVPAIRNRFGGLEDSWESKQMTMGTYNALFRLFKDHGVKDAVNSLFDRDSDVGEIYRRKSIMALRESAFVTAMYFMMNMLLSIVDGMGDDDDELGAGKIAALNLMAVLVKMENEAKSMVPVPGVGGIDEYLSNFGQFTNAIRDIEKVYALTTQGLSAVGYQMTGNEYLYEKGYYQQDSGLFKDGEARYKKSMMDLSGYMNVYEIFNPEAKMKNTLQRR